MTASAGPARQVRDGWVPAGDRPDSVDDELLIKALQRAVCWDETTARVLQPGPRHATTRPPAT
ncbi:hypothetical protein AB0J55_00565 [Amycolatopsis sp. NPDC049688]|uniref:hypothetical protein n=1 Tax=Amycolatopsis sp. NPDC049688 TaxID=3154733 RepID=UPI00341EDE4E